MITASAGRRSSGEPWLVWALDDMIVRDHKTIRYAGIEAAKIRDLSSGDWAKCLGWCVVTAHSRRVAIKLGRSRLRSSPAFYGVVFDV